MLDEGHNVTGACFHPKLPIIITNTGDGIGTVHVWHAMQPPKGNLYIHPGHMMDAL